MLLATAPVPPQHAACTELNLAVCTATAGFVSVAFKSDYWSLYNFMGVGQTPGGEDTTFTCPSGTVITGISGGKVRYADDSPLADPSWLAALQFYCSSKNHAPLAVNEAAAAAASNSGGCCCSRSNKSLEAMHARQCMP